MSRKASLSIRLKEKQKSKLRKLANKEDRSLAFLARQAIEDLLERSKKVDLAN